MKILTLPLLLTMLFVGKTKTNIDYKASTFFSMLSNSDLVILSEIVNQTDSTIILQIEEYLKGEIAATTLELRKFKDWPCASRYRKYHIGQKQINIIRKLDDRTYVGMSPGNENELPIDSGYIFIKSWLNRESSYSSGYGKISGFKFKLSDGLKGLREIIRLTESISSKEKDCRLLKIKSKSNMTMMIIEEQIMRMKLKNNCSEFNHFKFNIINQKMYRH